MGSGRPEAKVTGNLQKQACVRASGRLRTMDVRDKVRGKLSGKEYRSQTIWRDGWAALRFEATLPRLSRLSRRYHGFSDAMDIGSLSSGSTGPAPSESEAKAEVGIIAEPELGPPTPHGATPDEALGSPGTAETEAKRGRKRGAYRVENYRRWSVYSPQQGAQLLVSTP